MKARPTFALMIATLLLAGCAGEPSPSSTPAPAQSQEQTPSAEPSPTPTTLSWGPLIEEGQRAEEIVSGMTVAQKTGQVLMADLSGTTEVPPSLVAELHLGGLILMEHNILDVEQTKQLTDAFQEASKEASGADVPALIGIDQEGGLVQRYIKDQTPFPTAMAYGAIYEYDPEGAVDLVREAHRRLGLQLAELGVTIDFAPVGDVTVGASDPVIGARSFSSDTRAVTELTDASITGLTEVGIVPVIKHFPGHGSVSTDSHYDLPVYDVPLETVKARDWEPFSRAIENGVPVVMTGHIATQENPTVPASVDPENYELLAEELKFEGLNVTDALNMGAITQKYGASGAAVAALGAGSDLVLMPSDIRAAHQGIVAAVEDGTIPQERLDDAAAKVVTVKLYQQRLANERVETDPGPDTAFIQDVFARAITDVSEQCSMEPIAGAGSAVYGADATQQNYLNTELAEAPGNPANVALIGVDRLSVDGNVAVTLNSPWPLAQSQATHKYALYGRGPAAMAALADVLSGEKPAPGKLPSRVGDFQPGTGC